MNLEKIELRNFRCFQKEVFSFDAPVTFIIGNNGTGKTSLVEAIHYLCYLKSFRSRLPQEITQFDENNFFVKGVVTHEVDGTHELQVGFDQRKKIAKVDQRAIHSYKELFPYYQVITITIDDIALIQGTPSIRRNFVDQLILLQDHNYIEVLRKFKQILQQRNALLQGAFHKESFMIWTKQLWEISKIIQKRRCDALKNLEKDVSQLLVDFFDKSYSFEVEYKYKHIESEEAFDAFIQRKDSMISYEMMSRRSDFGAHLDDFVIHFCKKKVKSFGSRGQQKLLVLLIKIAQIVGLQDVNVHPIFLIDDFITDFDSDKLQKIINLLVSLKCQLIVTAPMRKDDLMELFAKNDIALIELKKKNIGNK